MPRILLGSENFREYQSSNDVYVDKTLMIKDLIEEPGKVLLMTRPRRFGKSLNLSMIRTFFEKTAEDNGMLFKNRKIWEVGEKYQKEQGKYPVIGINFKNVSGRNWETTLAKIKFEISDLYTSYGFLRPYLSKKDQLYFDDIEFKVATQEEYEYSLKKMSLWLETYTREKVFVLIDEYDAPINHGYTKGFKDDIIEFMRNLFGAAFKGNSSLNKGILTGVTRIAGESLFSGLNNFKSYSVLDHRYSEYFGFTEEETRWVMETCQVKHDFTEIKEWFDGYTFGNSRDIYNPWAIMNVAAEPEGMLQSYWINSGSDKILKDQLAKVDPKFKEIIFDMIQGEKRWLPVFNNITYDDLMKGTDGLWSFLLYAGYLTASDLKKEGNQPLMAKFFMPNLEVREAMTFLMAAWLNEQLGSSLETQEILDFMMRGECDLFSEMLGEYFKNSFSYFDRTNNKPELVYHAFILGLLSYLNNNYYFNSNPEAGRGRADILIMPKVGTYSKNAVILEFKKAKSLGDLEEKADLALEQIKEKQYINEGKKRGAKTIYCYGISFYKSELLVKMKVV